MKQSVTAIRGDICHGKYNMEITMRAIKNILWPTDASDSALRALEAAVVMAEKFDAKIHAFQVIEHIARPDRGGFAGESLGFDFHIYEQHLVESAQENLQAVMAENVSSSIRTGVYVELGSARETIQMFCRNNNIDLIVMATHGRRGFSHLLLGSVAEATVRQSPVPVMIIPQGEENSED